MAAVDCADNGSGGFVNWPPGLRFPGAPAAWQTASTAATSAGSPGRATARASPWKRPVQSVS